MPTVPQRYRQTEGRTDDSNTALALRASRGKNPSTFAKVTVVIKVAP